jgi:hypothetical protein
MDMRTIEWRKPRKVTSITIEANTSPCVNICRYCFVGDRDKLFAKFPFRRWMDFVQRFLDWKAENGDEAPAIDHGFPGPSFNFDLETYGVLNDWFIRRVGTPITGIPLGGVRLLPPDQMRDWLKDRRAFGLTRIHASFSGHGPNHDRWVGRRGEFEFLISAFGLATQMGISTAATMFLTKSSLPELESLAAALDATGQDPVPKHIRLVYYAGHGAHQEHERIDESDRAELPTFVREQLVHGLELHSEREWVPLVLNGSEPEPFSNVLLSLRLTPDNIDRLEALSCDEIVTELEAERRAFEARMPTFKWLAANCADTDGKRIYMKYDIFKLWRERYIQQAGIEVPRSLINKTVRPMRLHPVSRYSASSNA